MGGKFVFSLLIFFFEVIDDVHSILSKIFFSSFNLFLSFYLILNKFVNWWTYIDKDSPPIRLAMLSFHYYFFITIVNKK